MGHEEAEALLGVFEVWLALQNGTVQVNEKSSDLPIGSTQVTPGSWHLEDIITPFQQEGSCSG